MNAIILIISLIALTLTKLNAYSQVELRSLKCSFCTARTSLSYSAPQCLPRNKSFQKRRDVSFRLFSEIGDVTNSLLLLSTYSAAVYLTIRQANPDLGKDLFSNKEVGNGLEKSIVEVQEAVESNMNVARKAVEENLTGIENDSDMIRKATEERLLEAEKAIEESSNEFQTALEGNVKKVQASIEEAVEDLNEVLEQNSIVDITELKKQVANTKEGNEKARILASSRVEENETITENVVKVPETSEQNEIKLETNGSQQNTQKKRRRIPVVRIAKKIVMPWRKFSEIS